MNKWQKLGLVVGMGTAVVTTSHIINKFIFESATINNYTGKTVKHTYSWKFGNIAYSTYGNYDNPPLLLIHDLKAYSSGTNGVIQSIIYPRNIICMLLIY